MLQLALLREPVFTFKKHIGYTNPHDTQKSFNHCFELLKLFSYTLSLSLLGIVTCQDLENDECLQKNF